jgi:two-component sensor histidine kinase
VDFEQTTSGWRLEVSDEGLGAPEGFDIDQSKGFGMQVKSFVRRLNAKLATEYIDTAEIQKGIASAGSFKGCRVK